MKTYVRVYDSAVVEVIGPAVYPSDSPELAEPSWKAGDEIPISDRFTAEFVANLIDVTSISPQPQVNWVATEDGSSWSFSPPASSGK